VCPESSRTGAPGSGQTGSAVLAVEALVKTFAGFRALDGVSLAVKSGEVLGLVGPNGSGKTTCINVVCGLYPPDGGRVLFEGRDVSRLASHRLVHLGINRTFQVPKPFLSLSVRDNVAVASAYGQRPLSLVQQEELLASLQLDAHADQSASELNSVQQKMLDLARALATQPSLLCVDELAAGLNPAELKGVARHLRALAAKGLTMIVVEHLMGFIEAVTDRVVVLNAGHEIFEGALARAVHDPKVVESFLGGDDAVAL
jgi:branched-chain amino acid transport system ATP-binding protein